MKTTLPAESLSHESRIKEIANIIVGCAPDKIACVILFGSFARGTWVADRRSEDGAIYEYASDYDFLVITEPRTKEKNSLTTAELDQKIASAIQNSSATREMHKAHMVIEPIDFVNLELEKGRYFFSDIKKEGILLYDSKKYPFAEAKKLSAEEVKAIASQDYRYWFKSGGSFLKSTMDRFLDSDYEKATFQLHQAAESLYNCTLLVLASYKPKSHDLEELNRLCAAQSSEFLKIFPNANKDQKGCFELLKKSYSEARYNKNFKITKEQVEYLMQRVEVLKDTVAMVCKDRI